MKKANKEVLDLMKIDALSEAEKITGLSYKEDDITTSIGMFLHFEKNKKLRDCLASIDDTQFASSTDEYLRITGNFGFEVVLKEEFKCERGTDHLYVLFMKELGLVIVFDTYGKGVNGGSLYYNWSPNKYTNRYSLTSSGSFYFPDKDGHVGLFESDLQTAFKIDDYPKSKGWDCKDESWDEYRKDSDIISKRQSELISESGKRMLWIGHHDCREGIITIIKNLFENGIFAPIWQECPFSCITNYQEHKGNKTYPFLEYHEITKKRIDSMSEDFKKCINNTYRP